MRPTTFDLDALRSFVAGVELGSFAKAARPPRAFHLGDQRAAEEAGGAGPGSRCCAARAAAWP